MQPNDQYDFFMNPGAPQKRSPLAGLPGSKPNKKTLIIFGAAAVVFLIIVMIVISALFKGGPSNAEQLIGVTQKQQELMRVSEIALKDARGNEAKNLAMTTLLSLQSDQATLVSALASQKVKVGGKQLNGGKNEKTDATLTDAKQNNRFDEAYLEYVQEELANYQKSLNGVYKNTVSKSLKETLKLQYQNASILIGVEPEV